MGNTVNKHVEAVLDMDQGESLHAWAYDMSVASPAGRSSRAMRNRIRQGQKLENGGLKWGRRLSIAVESVDSGKTATVTHVDELGDAFYNGVQIGDSIIYIDKFDISDLAKFYSGLEDLNVSEPLTFSFEDLIHTIMNELHVCVFDNLFEN